MRSLYDFIIKPIGGRYNNKKQIGDKELIVNTEIFNHQYVNRTAEVLALPILVKTDVKVGDAVVVHHNVFRRWHNAHGKEQNSSNYIKKDMYAIRDDQIFAYKKKHAKDRDWQAMKDYCFIKPIKSNNKLLIDKEQPYMGIMKYTNTSLPNIQVGDLVGFTPSSEYEFIIDGERLYRVFTSEISIKYEYQGKEEEYNPSWLQGS